MKSSIASFAVVLFLACAAAIAAEPVGCTITDVNARTGVVTALDEAANRTLQFKAPPSLLRSLKVGQTVHADYRTRKVSVDGVAATLAIINVRPAEPVGEPTASAQAMSDAGGDSLLGGKRGLPPVKETTGTENPGGAECKAKGGEWRCTVVSTGSSPGPEDDVRSCVCINR